MERQTLAELHADDLRALVRARVGVSTARLQCPRAPSETTPCVARDGGLAATTRTDGAAICVGCEAFIPRLLREEHDKAAAR